MRDLVIVSLKRLAQDRRGISALEYGILAAVVVVAVAALGGQFTTLFSTVFATLTGSIPSAGGSGG